MLAYFGAIGSRVVKARNGTLPENLDGPFATLTASKAIKKCFAPGPTVEAPAHSSAAELQLEPEPEYVPVAGEPSSGTPEYETLHAGLTKIANQLAAIETECEAGTA